MADKASAKTPLPSWVRSSYRGAGLSSNEDGSFSETSACAVFYHGCRFPSSQQAQNSFTVKKDIERSDFQDASGVIRSDFDDFGMGFELIQNFAMGIWNHRRAYWRI